MLSTDAVHTAFTYTRVRPSHSTHRLAAKLLRSGKSETAKDTLVSN